MGATALQLWVFRAKQLFFYYVLGPTGIIFVLNTK